MTSSEGPSRAERDDAMRTDDDRADAPVDPGGARTIRVVAGAVATLFLALAVGGIGVWLGTRGGSDGERAAVDAGTGLDTVRATVGGETITQRDVEVEFQIQSLLREVVAGQTLNDAAAAENFKRELVGRLIDRQLAVIDARAQGIVISDAQLEQALPTLGNAMGVSSDQLRQAVVQSGVGLTEQDWQRWARAQLALQEYLGTQRAQVLAQEYVQTIGRAPEPMSAVAGMLYPTADVHYVIDGQPVAPARVGQPAPDFELLTPTGEPMRLSDLRGKPVMVNFWATWCVPCRAEMPLFVAVYNDNIDDLVVLGVNSQETPAQVTPFLEQLGITFPNVIDADGSVSSIYRVNALPTTFFVDAEGMLVDRHRGAIRSRPELGEFLQKILPGVQLGFQDLTRPMRWVASAW